MNNRVFTLTPFSLLFLLTAAPSMAQSEPAAATESATESATEQTPTEHKLYMPRPNQGHFISLGLGFIGTLANDTERGTRGPGYGMGYSLRLGEGVTNWLDLGIGLTYANTGTEAHDLTLGRLVVEAQWYPSDRAFVRTAFGFGVGGGVDPHDPEFDRFRFGDVYVLGAGAHFYLGDSNESGGWVMSPVATFEIGPDEEFTTMAASLGIEFSYWGGLPRNQLELPIDKAYRGEE